MTPAVAIALAYTVVGAGILIYLQRVRRRLRKADLRKAEADLRAQGEPSGSAEALTVR